MLKPNLKAPAGALAVLFLIMQQAAFLLVLSLPAQAEKTSMPPLSVKIQPLPSPLAGLISVQAKLSAPPDSLRFKVIGSDNDIYQSFVGQKLNETNYYFDWQTQQFANGSYRLAVSAIKGNYLAYDELAVEVKNFSNSLSANTSASTEAQNQTDSADAGQSTDSSVFSTSTNPTAKATSSDSTADSQLLGKETENNPAASDAASQETANIASSTSADIASSSLPNKTSATDNQNNNNDDLSGTAAAASVSSAPVVEPTGAVSTSSPKAVAGSELAEKDLIQPVPASSTAASQPITSASSSPAKSSSSSALPTKLVRPAAENSLAVEISAPANSERVQGKVTLTAKTTVPALAVSFYWQPADFSGHYNIIGSAQADEKRQAWRLVWPTTNLANGVYVLQAQAKSQSGKIFYSQPVAIEISNPALNTSHTGAKIPAEPTDASSSATGQRRHLSLATSSALLHKAKGAKIKTRVKVKDRFVGEKIVVAECQKKNITDKDQCWQFLQKQYGVFAACTGLTAAECSAQLRSNFILSARQMISLQRLPQECLAAGIDSLAECELLLRSQYAAQACLGIGLNSKDECGQWLEKKYVPLIKCQALSSRACQNLRQKVVLADFVSPRLEKRIKKELKIIVNKHIIVAPGDLPTATSAQIIIARPEQTLAAGREFTRLLGQVLPLRPAKGQKNKLLVLPSAEQDKETSGGAILLFDADGDGLSDDLEARLGTDPKKKDSDGDGYNDKEEILSGHNPLGSGRLAKNLAPIDKAIASGRALAEPKQTGRLTPALKVLSVQTTATSSAGPILHLSGQALAKQVISLYIYSSLPIVITVKTDENGNWVYDLDKTLVDGRHEIYVAINNEDGSIAAKSAPFTFFIKSARAASADDFIASPAAASASGYSRPEKKMVNNYILAGLAMIISALAGFWLYYHHQRHNNQAAA